MSGRPAFDAKALPPAARERGPLEGLRVLDLATMTAAPWSATYLADHGADVDALDELIAAWMAEHELEDVLTRFDEAGVAATAMQDISQIAAHPHFRARELLLRVDDPRAGPDFDHPRAPAAEQDARGW